MDLRLEKSFMSALRVPDVNKVKPSPLAPEVCEHASLLARTGLRPRVPRGVLGPGVRSAVAEQESRAGAAPRDDSLAGSERPLPGAGPRGRGEADAGGPRPGRVVLVQSRPLLLLPGPPRPGRDRLAAAGRQ